MRRLPRRHRGPRTGGHGRAAPGAPAPGGGRGGLRVPPLLMPGRPRSAALGSSRLLSVVSGSVRVRPGPLGSGRRRRAAANKPATPGGAAPVTPPAARCRGDSQSETGVGRFLRRPMVERASGERGMLGNVVPGRGQGAGRNAGLHGGIWGGKRGGYGGHMGDHGWNRGRHGGTPRETTGVGRMGGT